MGQARVQHGDRQRAGPRAALLFSRHGATIVGCDLDAEARRVTWLLAARSVTGTAIRVDAGLTAPTGAQATTPGNEGAP